MNSFHIDAEHLYKKKKDVNYGAPHGSKRLLDLLQLFFTRHFKPHYPLQSDHIFTQTGAGASVNQLIMSIADEGDYCMLPGPYYGAFDLDISVHTGVNILEVFPHGLVDTTIDGDELERVYQQAKNEGKRITSILVTNPDNPLGRYELKNLYGGLFLTPILRIYIYV